MDFLANLVINSICIAILIVLLFVNLKNMKTKMFTPLFLQLIIVVGIILFIVDTLGRMDGTTNISVPFVNKIGNFLLFSFNPVLAILWLIHVLYYVVRDKKSIKKLAFPFIFFFASHLTLVIANLFFGFYYTIDSNNIYTRGPLYSLSILWAVLPLIVAFILTLVDRRRIDYRKFKAFLFFPLAPVIGTILSFYTYGYSIVLPTMMVGILLVFLGIQNDSINADYLTGTFNRRYLEDCLRKKMAESNPTFAGIMLDIDSYKRINDTFGHIVGDRALVDFAHILSKSVGLDDIVARYGGDEFMIIVEAKNQEQLEKVIDNIKANIERFNDKKLYPFALTASIGKSMYKPENKQTMEQFINCIDDLMYKEKKNCRSNVV